MFPPQSSQVLGGATTLFGVFVLALPVPIILNTYDNTSTSISARSQQLSWIFHFSIVLWNQPFEGLLGTTRTGCGRMRWVSTTLQSLRARLVVTIINLPLVVLSMTNCYWDVFTSGEQQEGREAGDGEQSCRRSKVPPISTPAHMKCIHSDIWHQ